MRGARLLLLVASLIELVATASRSETEVTNRGKEKIGYLCRYYAQRYQAKTSSYTIKYRLVKTLGPTNKPNQNTRLPKTFLPFNNLVRLNAANGSCISCMANR